MFALPRFALHMTARNRPQSYVRACPVTRSTRYAAAYQQTCKSRMRSRRPSARSQHAIRARPILCRASREPPSLSISRCNYDYVIQLLLLSSSLTTLLCFGIASGAHVRACDVGRAPVAHGTLVKHCSDIRARARVCPIAARLHNLNTRHRGSKRPVGRLDFTTLQQGLGDAMCATRERKLELGGNSVLLHAYKNEKKSCKSCLTLLLLFGSETKLALWSYLSTRA